MRIFSSSHSDPMLLASIGQLQAIYGRLAEFVRSSEPKVEIKANCNGSPKPYDTLLEGLRLSKTSDKASLRISGNGWLELDASQSELESFSEKFKIQEGHTHWYGSPSSLIIEVSDES